MGKWFGFGRGRFSHICFGVRLVPLHYLLDSYVPILFHYLSVTLSLFDESCYGDLHGYTWSTCM